MPRLDEKVHTVSLNQGPFCVSHNRGSPGENRAGGDDGSLAGSYENLGVVILACDE